MRDDTPLDVMLRIMAKHGAAGDDKLALDAAKAAAPYVHGRAVKVRPSGDVAEMTDEELEAYCDDDEEEEREEAEAGDQG